MEKVINLFIADDHEVLRFGLKQMINFEPRLKIVGEAKNGAQAIQMIKILKPDVALIDIIMPDIDGIEVAGEIKKHSPSTKIILFTAVDDSQHIDQAIAIGVNGYIVKNGEMDELIQAVYKVYKGERVYSKSLIMMIQNGVVIKNKDSENYSVPMTKREEEILHFIARGKSSYEISNLLGISDRTVERHRSNIMSKLNIKKSSVLIRYAVLNYPPD
jgi:DNA-binding NarL/FixJ family response regulator